LWLGGKKPTLYIATNNSPLAKGLSLHQEMGYQIPSIHVLMFSTLVAPYHFLKHYELLPPHAFLARTKKQTKHTEPLCGFDVGLHVNGTGVSFF
jgi:hypothetical protein